MALATQCPHCKTTFRVAQDQLKLRGGIVRCGACHEIFDGNASLVDLAAAPADSPAPAPIASPAPPAPPAGAHEEMPVYTLDLGHALDPLGILPKPEEDEAPVEVRIVEPLPEPPEETPQSIAHDNRVEPSLHDAHEETVVAPLPDIEAAPAPRVSFAPSAPVHTPLPQRASADAPGAPAPIAAPEVPKSARARQQARRSKLTPTRIEPPKLRVPEIDEPEFVRRGRQREQSGKRRLALWAGGSALLLLVLLAQAAYIFRNEIAVRAPALKPALASACSLLHCRVELPARIDNLTIETGELQTLAPDTYVLTTLLHNQAGVAQAWPAIELALTDANDKPLVRRVFAPADYLPKDAGAAGFAPRGEQPVKLYFQLDQLKPSGYHIAVFYP